MTGYTIRTEYAEINGRLVRSYEEIVFPCGCSFPFAQITSEEIVKETPDGTSLVELTVTDIAGEPVMSWIEPRESAEVF
ncbi:hypothetical protein J3R08_002505 [Micromonospora sp. HB375]|uniref:hypothetical protein n=1 Tax=unclassified Micromonospora TaxID=2617518 RepID=UPI001AEACD7D|nr:MULTISPECIES: hypothetical protein [unclassified Micromonospora]MBP1782655.1 hypothetical protein [Micromonospora sp. HB375]MDH6468518.1 hypothetical protein [Micromonospora sp. H404/HB375]